MRAARRAGTIPAMVPATIITNVASKQTPNPTVGFRNMVISNNPESTVFDPAVASK